jgi:hypothetical protein
MLLVLKTLEYRSCEVEEIDTHEHAGAGDFCADSAIVGNHL